MEKIKEYSEFYGDTIFVKKLTATIVHVILLPMRHHTMDSSLPSVS